MKSNNYKYLNRYHFLNKLEKILLLESNYIVCSLITSDFEKINISLSRKYNFFFIKNSYFKYLMKKTNSYSKKKTSGHFLFIIFKNSDELQQFLSLEKNKFKSLLCYEYFSLNKKLHLFTPNNQLIPNKDSSLSFFFIKLITMFNTNITFNINKQLYKFYFLLSYKNLCKSI